LIPAGSLVSCTTGDGKISSKTTAIGDPVLCKVEHRRGDFMLPYGSYLGGEFSEFKDPGHFVGKGWMELSFDRMYIGDTVIPVNAKVVNVPGYNIDAQGRVLGKGHAVRDTVMWMIPVLWPIDLLMLPRRGPRPTLKTETALTLRVMEDIQVPAVQEPQRDPSGLMHRSPDAYAPDPPRPTQQPDPAPEYSYVPQQEQEPAQPPAMAYAQPVPVPYYMPVPVFPVVAAYGPYGPMIVAAQPMIAAYAPPVYYALPPPMAAYSPRVGYYGYGGRSMVRAGVAYGMR
jgi:hypothetical protein